MQGGGQGPPRRGWRDDPASAGKPHRRGRFPERATASFFWRQLASTGPTTSSGASPWPRRHRRAATKEYHG